MWGLTNSQQMSTKDNTFNLVWWLTKTHTQAQFTLPTFWGVTYMVGYTFLSQIHWPKTKGNCNFSISLTDLFLPHVGPDGFPMDWCHHEAVKAGGLDPYRGPSNCGLFPDQGMPLDQLGRGIQGNLHCFFLSLLHVVKYRSVLYDVL